VSTPTERTFRGRSAQERRDERRRRLLDAGLDLIGTDGWASATMTAICARAGLTERYFYESFSDREALYLALIDDIARDTEAAILSALDGDGAPAERLSAATRAVVESLVTDPRRGRVALLEGLGSTALQERRRDIIRGFERLVGDHFAAVFGAAAGGPRDIDLVLLGGAVSELVSRRLDGTLDATDDELVERIVALAEWIAGGAGRSG
jgi:AcrR family transcriptional regulator